MKKGIRITALLFGVLFLAQGALASESEGTPEEQYRLAVMKILKLHLHAIESLNRDPGLRYAENMTRHAVALNSTTQLLDHVYPENAMAMEKSSGRPWTDKKTFESMVVKSQKSSEKLVVAAKAWQAGKRDGMSAAVKDLRESCRSCHDIFREIP